jgi:ABC-2 type transport system permease protein
MWTLFKKDMLRLKKQPTGFLVLIVLPIIATALFGIVFRGGDTSNLKPYIKLIIEDHDDSFMSRMIISGFAQKEMVEYFDVELAEKGEGQAFIEEDRASALVIIPQGFTEAFFSAEQTEIQVIKNPSREFGPKIVEEVFKIIAEASDRVIRIAEAPFKAIKQEIDKNDFSPDRVIAKIAVMINQIMRKTIPMIEESPITIKSRIESDDTSKSDNNALLILLLSGVGTMCLYFLLENLGVDFFRERENHTLKRILVSPASATSFVLSKLLYLVIAGFLSLAIVWALGCLIWGIEISLSQVFPFLTMLLLISISSSGIISFFYVTFSNRNQASTILGGMILIFALFGGGIIPFVVLPAFFKQLSFFSPIYWSANGLQKILINSSNFSGLFKNMAILGLISLCCISASILLQRRRAM